MDNLQKLLSEQSKDGLRIYPEIFKIQKTDKRCNKNDTQRIDQKKLRNLIIASLVKMNVPNKKIQWIFKLTRQQISRIEMLHREF